VAWPAPGHATGTGVGWFSSFLGSIYLCFCAGFACCAYGTYVEAAMISLLSPILALFRDHKK